MDLLQVIVLLGVPIIAGVFTIVVARINGRVRDASALSTSEHNRAVEERFGIESKVMGALGVLHDDVRDVQHRVGVLDGRLGGMHAELQEHIMLDTAIRSEQISRFLEEDGAS